jgi:hypothetical protein
VTDTAPGSRPLEWQVFADATCAGLTPLIPIPFVDLILEIVFRRRIPSAIARKRGVELSPSAIRQLGQGEPWLTLAGCLALPFKVLLWVIKRVWRKIVYVLAVADAVESVSEYWHRAYLIDHAVRAGHLEESTDVDWSVHVIRTVLAEADTSPLRTVARQVVGSAGRVVRFLLRARRSGAAEATGPQERIVEADWGQVQESLRQVAVRYNELYPTRDEVLEELEAGTGSGHQDPS